MKKHQNGMFFVHFYAISSFLAPFLSVYVHNVIYFIGASSIPEAFLYALGSESKIAALVFLLWAITAVIMLVWFYIIAIVKRNIKPIVVLIAIDLGISCVIRILVACRGSLDNILLFSILCRIAFYAAAFWEERRWKTD